ncbi:alpha-1,6-rhamnosyltransferase [Pseudomonas frederiksbergensis]|jgi:Glycosyltransferases, probably involved in cell wall biogenesis|uniref:Alpha-1,6-rhamnosyltransferase n=1 Tax=Pseudomonas frederiksbergensis TaxID=104087 RepID=A0A1H5JC91_9PSED|nr:MULTISPECIES: glycosyltransferase family 2 protein [Pseudomonas]APV40853.1 glycosyl transferase [Pseudomonas frederiksbergensis]PMU10211.1 glycosyltransferase family 2 protein [Pseudomonas sp. FW305-20]PMU19047.1 glycosyltransferase family 2 protein [Pseudomonas sp. FW305-122]PMU42391.1 glycosyltransferase family 2 protein [Pseudomonas sp. FW305-47B]PMX62750.1 glycosyltransferase family 2 protein [Pseudomonas sp. FW305-33]
MSIELNAPEHCPSTPAPLVSIVASCYNMQKFVEDALKSIFAQDYPNFEVIIVNDGSSDDSLAILERLQQTYDFQLYSQPNQGVSAALNHGLRYAKGVYVATPDLDDIMLPGSVRMRAEYLDQHPNVGCVGALVSYMDSDGNTIKQQHRDRIHTYNFDQVLRGAVVVGAPVALYRMKAMRSADFYAPKLRVQDFQMTLRIARLGYEIHELPICMSRYRRHANNLSRKYRTLLQADLEAIAPYVNHPGYQSARTRLVNKALKYAVVEDKKEAWQLLRSIPWRHLNRTSFKRFKRLVLHR